MRGRRRVLIIVQNLPVPLDRRVWMEATALARAGYGVSVICPRGPGDTSRAVIDDVRIYTYAPPPQARGALGYLVEFVYCWVMTALLSVTVLVHDGFAVIQACNPPDTYFALARLYRLLGKRFVYDQHDLNPEVFVSRFGPPRTTLARAQHRALLGLERATYRSADHVIATNESYRRVALGRGGCAPETVTVVRSGPDTAAMRPVQAPEALRHGRAHLAVYLGIMGPQDGVDLLLRAWDVLVRRHGREDCHLALLGFGDCLDDLRALTRSLHLEPWVTFTGRADARMIAEYLSAATVGLCPDPSSPLNDVSTMNKTMEYMAYALPVVSFDLPETRVSTGEAAVLVPPGDLEGFVDAIERVLDDPALRLALGREARARVTRLLDWTAQEERYLSVYAHLLGAPARIPRQRSWPAVERRRGTASPTPLVDPWGRRLVDLREGGELDEFVPSRRVAQAEEAAESDPAAAATIAR